MIHNHGHDANNERIAPFHGPRTARALIVAALVLGAYLAVEFGGAIVSGSLALLADAAHTGSDLVALGLALVATWMASRPHTAKRTFGHARAEVLAALASGVVLLAMVGFITYEAVGRLSDPPEVRGLVVSLVALGGLTANGIAALVLSRAGPGLNVRAALLHVAGDALGSLGVVVGGLMILAFGWNLADPIISFGIAGLLLFALSRIVREALRVLMESAPAHVDVGALLIEMEAMPRVRDVHDIHVWTITSGYHAMSAHVAIDTDCTPAQTRALQRDLRALVADRYRIGHVTIQLESGAGVCVEAHDMEEARG